MMKRLLLTWILLLVVVGMSMAGVVRMTATSMAYKVIENEKQTEWSEWMDCELLVTIDIEGDRIKIYSNEIQIYDVYDHEEEEPDGDGGASQLFYCVDAKGKKCELRFRLDADAELQLYIEYPDLKIVYNLDEK